MLRKRWLSKRKAPASGIGHKVEVDKLAWKARLAIRVIGGALVLAFGWLQLQNFPFVPILESTPAGFVLKVALTLYYFSWVLGTGTDVNVQQSVYVHDRDRGRLGWLAIFGISAFFLIAALLLWNSDDERSFAVALSAFVLVNLAGWAVTVRRVLPMIHMSLIEVEQDYFEVERLHLVQDYIAGFWQWHRFLAMGLIAATNDMIVFLPEVRSSIAAAIMSRGLGLKESVISHLLPALTFVVFLSIAEGWIWAMRIKTSVSLNVSVGLKEKYRLMPIVSGSR